MVCRGSTMYVKGHVTYKKSSNMKTFQGLQSIIHFVLVPILTSEKTDFRDPKSYIYKTQ